MTLTTTLAGTALTSVLFITLFGMVALIMNSAMAHTDTMLENMNLYIDNPTEQNKLTLEQSIDDTDTYITDITSISADFLKKYLDTVDSSILTDDEKKSLIESKKMLDKIETKDPTDPDAIELKNSLQSILNKLNPPATTP
ncbi:MAG: hypothetical protein KAH93_01085 [Candidatus Aenigmarchaeota archaeon]|nr:hypothetical protein [Candidatus Aenigmarchaeota archaeon]